MKDIFPPPEDVLNLEPEELAVFLLEYLREAEKSSPGSLNRYNFTLQSTLGLYAGEKYDEVSKVMIEAWIWLEREGMIAPKPGTQGEWAFITRRGQRLVSKTDFTTYLKGSFLPEQSLDPVLARKVRPLFIRGDYDTAVFQAFKEVEIRVRNNADLPVDLIGVELMRKAFHPDNGPLTDKKQILAEREATSHLFAGAIGLLKNPSSHRDVSLNNPGEVAELILFANYLIRLADRHAKKD
jgi:uncharacterized protein (TIGR02391 family)